MRWLVFVFMLFTTPLFAVEPDEILDDPVLEARAREISKGLRCLVCQNESIDESHAPLARDLRILLRERLTAGYSDTEAIDFIVARYGEFVLLRPTTSGANIILWIAGPLMLIIALGTGALFIRRRASLDGATNLTDEEKARLNQILGD